MTQESEIYEGATSEPIAQSGFYDFKLLRATAYTTIYRASKGGKYFLIKTTKDNTPHQLAMLRREYEISIGCDHPHIVHIYTLEENLPVGVGVVMEYIEGRTLADYLAENPSATDRNRIFKELLSAVGYLHNRGVIHNDLKPENILVTRADNSLKLIDFGLADNDADFALRTLGCTPTYASPELRMRSGQIDARSDIYSIGVLMAVIFGTKHRCIAKRCINENPDKRYKNIAALQLAWAHRDRPLKAVLGVVAAAIFILPLLLLGQIKLAEYNKLREREQIFSKIERDVEQIYAATSDSLSRVEYCEFANHHIVSFWNKLSIYRQEQIETITDAELCSLATNVYSQTATKCHNKLCKQTNALPSVYREHMTFGEIKFYDSLILNGKPYRPYRAESPQGPKR